MSGIQNFFRSLCGNSFNGLLYETQFQIPGWYAGNSTEVKVDATFTQSGSDVIISSPTDRGVTQYTAFTNWSTCLEDFTYTCKFKNNSNSAKLGFHFGSRCTIGPNNSWYATFNPQSKYIGITNLATLISNSGNNSVVVNDGDEFEATLSRNNDLFTATIYNLTVDPGKTTPVSCTATLIYNPINYVSPSTCWPALLPITGTFDIHSLKLTTNYRIGMDLMCVGDSITQGLIANDRASRWANVLQLLGASGITYNVAGGPGDTTASILSRINEIKILKPKNVLLCIGTNDVAAGNIATAQTNYPLIVNALTAAGINVINVTAIPRNGVAAIATWNTFLTGTYSGVIDTYTALNNAGNIAAQYNSGDGVHPNTAGHILIATNTYASALIQAVIGSDTTNIVYNQKTIDYYAQFTNPPTTADKNIMDRTIRILTNGGVWNKFDTLYCLGSQEDLGSRVNMITPGTFTASKVSTPTLTNKQGWAGNGTTTYLNTNYNPSINAVNYTQNDNCHFVYCRTTAQTAIGFIGFFVTGGPYSYMLCRYTDDQTYCNTTTATGGAVTAAATYGGGITLVQRNSSIQNEIFKNGVSLSLLAANSGPVQNASDGICAALKDGTTFGFGSTAQYAWRGVGGKLTGAQNATLYRALQLHMTLWGTQV